MKDHLHPHASAQVDFVPDQVHFIEELERFKILEKIYGITDYKHLFKLFFQQSQKCFNFDSQVFYQLKPGTEPRLRTVALKLPEKYQSLLLTYQNQLELSIKEFPVFQECLTNRSPLRVSPQKISLENNFLRKRYQYFEFDKPVMEAIFFPVFSPDQSIFGILMVNSVDFPLPEQAFSHFQKILYLFSPVLYHSLLIKDLTEKQSQIEQITLKYREVLKLLIDFNQLLELEEYFVILTKKINEIFGFDVSFVQFENHGRLPISHGSGKSKTDQEIFDIQKNYFGLEKNAPLVQGTHGPEMSCAMTFLNQSHYYAESLDVFYHSGIQMLEKDKIALEMMGKPLLSLGQFPIIDNGKSIGLLQLWSFSKNVPMSSHDIEMMNYICSFIPSIFKNTALHQDTLRKNKEIQEKNKIIRSKNNQLIEELKLARTIQQGLIPSASPSIPGMELAFLYKPMEEVGGDFF